MLVPILCFTCGSAIGDVEDLYLSMRAARVAAALAENDTAAVAASIDPKLQIDCRDILELLNVRFDCCRAHLITCMQFSDLY